VSRQSRVLEALRDGTVGARSIRAVCPFCERKGYSGRKKNLDFDKARGWWLCWRCNSRGKIDGWETSDAAAELAPSDVTTFDPPKSFISIGRGKGRQSMLTYGARTYAAKRGIGVDVWERANLGQIMRREGDQDFTGRLIVPIMSVDEDFWLGWVGRDFTGEQESYKYPLGMNRGRVLYNQRALYVRTDVPVLGVEGTLDTMPFFPNAVAFLGTYSQPQIDMMKDANRPILVVLDGDAWRKAEVLAWLLHADGVRAGSYRLPPKKDPDECVEEVLYAMENIGKHLLT